MEGIATRSLYLMEERQGGCRERQNGFRTIRRLVQGRDGQAEGRTDRPGARHRADGQERRQRRLGGHHAQAQRLVEAEDRRAGRSDHHLFVSNLTMASDRTHTGGCLCGAVRYEASGEPTMMGYCYCKDCQKASGSGFIPFMGFKAEQLSFTGRTLEFTSPSIRGTPA